MKVAVFLLWLLFPLSVWGVLTIWGTPHVALSWTFQTSSSRYDPLADRYYLTCTYYGWTGAHRVPAHGSNCPWLLWRKGGTR